MRAAAAERRDNARRGCEARAKRLCATGSLVSTPVELARIVPSGVDTAVNRLERAKGLSGTVTLDLFPGVSVTAQRTDIEAPEDGGYVWVGETGGNLPAFVTLVINNDEIVGQIQTGGKLYSIEPVSGRLHRIIEINQDRIRDDLHAPEVPEVIQKQNEDDLSPDKAAPKAATTITVMVAHTVNARNEMAGTVAQKQTRMQQRINLAISQTNQAFSRSGILIKFVRVGGANEINYNDVGSYGVNTEKNYVGVLCDLSGFANSGACAGVGNNQTAKFDALRNKRNSVKADLVALMRKEGLACGIAWVPNLNGIVSSAAKIYGFSVTTASPSYGCVEGNTFAHETGHNQGMNHDRVQNRIDRAFDDGDADSLPSRPRHSTTSVTSTRPRSFSPSCRINRVVPAAPAFRISARR